MFGVSSQTKLQPMYGLSASDILLALFLNAVPASEQIDFQYYTGASMVNLNEDVAVRMAHIKEDIFETYLMRLDGGITNQKYQELTVMGITRTLNVNLNSLTEFDARGYEALYGAGVVDRALKNVLRQKCQSTISVYDPASPANVSQFSSSPANNTSAEEELYTPIKTARKRLSFSPRNSFGSMTSMFSSLISTPTNFGSPPELPSANTSASNSAQSSRAPSPSTQLPFTPLLLDEEESPRPVSRRFSIPKLQFFPKKPGIS